MSTQRLLPVLFLALAGAPLTAQGLPIPDPLGRANGQSITYCPPERLAFGPATNEQNLNVFLPPGDAPAGGWPVVVTTLFGGGTPTPPVTQLSSSGPTRPLWEILGEGIAIVLFGSVGVSNGDGMFFPPGHASGRYESYHPNDDNPEKAAEWAIQWVKTQSQFPLDTARVGYRGSSGGAVIGVRATMGPERARATGSAQVRASTRVEALLVLQPPTSAWAFVQDDRLTTALAPHFERTGQPGVAATRMDQVTFDLQRAYSIMHFAFDSADARANNAKQKIFMVYGDAVSMDGGAPATMALDAGGFPILHDRVLQPTQHDGWFGYIFWKSLREISPQAAAFHDANSGFAMRNTTALSAPYDWHTTTYTGTFKSQNANDLGRAWLADALGAEPPVQSGPPVLEDGGFEGQTPGGLIGEPWSLGVGSHFGLDAAQTPETGFPTQGSRWLELRSNGTSGTTPPSNPGGVTQPPQGGAGVFQTFTVDAATPWLAFDAALVLRGDAASSARNDWMSVDVSDGQRTVNVYYADSFSPLTATSTRFGLPMTPVRDVRVDLPAAFPGLTPSTVLTVTLQVGNGGDSQDPSRGYVDDLRLIAAPDVTPYGCLLSTGSVTLLDGGPFLGSTMRVGVDDHEAPGVYTAVMSLALATASAPRFPCGLPLQGWGPRDTTGELLVDVSQTLPPPRVGSAWAGPGQPVPFEVALPANPALVGAELFLQGVVLDLSGNRLDVGLLGALRVVLAD